MQPVRRGVHFPPGCDAPLYLPKRRVVSSPQTSLHPSTAREERGQHSTRIHHSSQLVGLPHYPARINLSGHQRCWGGEGGDAPRGYIFLFPEVHGQSTRRLVGSFCPLERYVVHATPGTDTSISVKEMREALLPPHRYIPLFATEKFVESFLYKKSCLALTRLSTPSSSTRQLWKTL